MSWKKYTDMKQALAEIPESGEPDTGYSTPDVYGKAVQFYIALRDSVHDQWQRNLDSVDMWRSLVTILALRNSLKLPLYWERVRMPEEEESGQEKNLLSNALRHPPATQERNPERLLFPDHPEWQWDGSTFFVLKWDEQTSKSIDLLLFSPVTLVYPVADWREIFAALPDPAISRFYDRREGFLNPVEVLNGAERAVVYYWLENMWNYFEDNYTVPNSAQKVIRSQLDKYMKELDVFLTATDRQNLRMSEFSGGNIGLDRFFPLLNRTVDPPGVLREKTGQEKMTPVVVFSDQICYFKAKENPFIECEYSECYKIENSGESSGDNWYAFLPIHPAHRADCRSSGLAESVKMRRMEGPGGVPVIHVSMELRSMPGRPLEWDYIVSGKPSAAKKTAVPFPRMGDMNASVDVNEWPLIAIWPGVVGEAWNEYYIMIEDDGGTEKLVVDTSCDQAKDGSNPYVVRTAYVPNAIPIARKLPDGQVVSVGVVTPRIEKIEWQERYVEAEVAVDFGTSSTRVFARIDGDETVEIHINDDEPLAVTAFQDSRNKVKLMSSSFISPDMPEETSNTLFSIYRRSSARQLSDIQPMLDGTIYQAHPKETVEDTKHLISDLKWNMRASEKYYIAFMKQLCLHVMVLLYREHGVHTIHWKYSLPKSMTEADKVLVKRIWKGDLEHYLKRMSGGNFTHIIDNNSLTESVAASRYFLNRGRLNIRKGYLVVDIGGGSTDVALWQGPSTTQKVLLWHTSVKIAGQKLFTQWVDECLDSVRTAVQNPDLKELINVIGKANPNVRKALVDRLLNTYEADLMSVYGQNCLEKPGDWGTDLCRTVNQGIALLMFSLGYQVGVLMKAGKFEIPSGAGSFTIAVGGRGCKILDWLRFDLGIQKELFRRGMEAVGIGVDRNLRINIQKSPNPKCEVALGLLVQERTTEKDETSEWSWDEDAGGTWTTPGEAQTEEDENADRKPGHTEYYVDAAAKFCEAFRSAYQDRHDGNGQLDMEDIDTDELSNEFSRGYGYGMNQILNVLMEVIYPCLSGLNLREDETQWKI